MIKSHTHWMNVDSLTDHIFTHLRGIKEDFLLHIKIFF